MRKIIVSEFVSLDGMMSDPGDTMKWVIDNFSEKAGAYEKDLYDSLGTLMLGRTTYDIWAAYWPSALTKGEANEEAALAVKIDRVAKILVSSKAGVAYWGSGDTKQLTAINRDEILELKKQAGGDIAVIGSASIVQQLTALGLVDEYHFLVFPLTMGKGKALFSDDGAPRQLELIETRDLGKGIVLSKYKRAAQVD